jgi:hypothetical protein
MMPRTIEEVIKQRKAELNYILNGNINYEIAYLKRIEELKDSSVINHDIKERNDKQILDYNDLLIDIRNEIIVIKKEIENL